MSFSKDIPADDSDLQAPPSEPEKRPGYVKNKVKITKNPTQNPRARVKESSQVSQYVEKVIKKVAKLRRNAGNMWKRRQHSETCKDMQKGARRYCRNLD